MTDLLLPDARQRRLDAAWRAHEAYDIALPHLEYWNYDPCARHKEWVNKETGELVVGKPKPDCEYQACGGLFRRHQRVGVTWLYLAQRGLLADSVGTGKTLHAAGLLALMAQREELHYNARALIVMRPTALMQFQSQLYRFTKNLHIMTAMGTARQRIDRYLQPWHVGLIGYQMLLNDLEKIQQFDINTIIVDDVDALRNRDNRTAYAIKKVARDCDRAVVMTGTPLQKRLQEMHSVLEPLGGREIFGSPSDFMRRYIREEAMTVYDNHRGRRRNVHKVVGYKNVDEFKRLLQPLALRRTAADIDDVDIPAIVVDNVILELYPKQRAKYQELRGQVLRIIREEGAQLKQMTAMARLHDGARICAGLAALGEADLPETACKLDWVMDKVADGGDLEDEKVVIFVNYKDTIRAMQKRLGDAGIGYETIWGDEPDKAVRFKSQERFWRDSRCRILMGTSAIEQSLNLQCARHLINVDQILNPARMTQLAGRIQRDGSAWKHVIVHNLLCQDTQEDGYMPLLEREQALIDTVWSENSELFESLPALALMQLITG